jgi:Tol biopolymer transport system component
MRRFLEVLAPVALLACGDVNATDPVDAVPSVDAAGDGDVGADAAVDATPLMACNSKLAFEVARDIHVAGLDGIGAVNVSSDPKNDNEPAWTPDGRVLFHSVRDAGEGIYVADTDGRNLSNLTESLTGFIEWFRISPDGNQLAFARTNLKLQRSVWVMSVNGENLRKVSDRPAWPPIVWSPDGSRILYVDHDDSLVVVDVAIPQATPIVPNVPAYSITASSWSPSGDKLLVSRAGDVWQFDADGRGAQNLTPDTASSTEKTALWTSDGKVVFSSDRRDGIYRIYITEDAGGAALPLSNPAAGPGDSAVQMSPDGDNVLFVRSYDGSNEDVGYARTDGSGDSHGFVITPRAGVAWSPCLD